MVKYINIIDYYYLVSTAVTTANITSSEAITSMHHPSTFITTISSKIFDKLNKKKFISSVHMKQI